MNARQRPPALWVGALALLLLAPLAILLLSASPATGSPAGTAVLYLPAVMNGAPTAALPTFGMLFGDDYTYYPTDTNKIASLGIKTMVIWFWPQYYELADQTLDMGSVQAVFVGYREGTGGLNLVVHVMPPSNAQQLIIMPPDLNLWSAQLTQLAAGLRGQIQGYSIGNEISNATFAGTVDDYNTLLATSYAALKAGDSQAVVLDSGMGSITHGLDIAQDLYNSSQYTDALNFVNDFYLYHSGGLLPWLPLKTTDDLTAMLNDSFNQTTEAFSEARFTLNCPYYDVLQIHYYQPWQYQPQVSAWIKGRMSANNCQKPIQFWELGYALDPSRYTYDPDEHARDVPKLLAEAVAANSQLIAYATYLEDGNNWQKGLRYRDGTCLPSATAYQVAAQKLQWATGAETLTLGVDVVAYHFTTSGGDVYAVWRDITGTSTVALPISADWVNVTSHLGVVTTADPHALAVGDSPLFVEPLVNRTPTP
ncbi:MAG: hypothetical protein HYR71_07285, partial [Chloroflexi bacterium]|nr:hypothetical protein [Chloroflexota bacterium]